MRTARDVARLPSRACANQGLDVAHDPIPERADVGRRGGVPGGGDGLADYNRDGGAEGPAQGKPSLRPPILASPQADRNHRHSRGEGNPRDPLLPWQQADAITDLPLR